MVVAAFQHKMKSVNAAGRRAIGADFSPDEVEKIDAWGVAAGMTSRKASIRALTLAGLRTAAVAAGGPAQCSTD